MEQQSNTKTNQRKNNKKTKDEVVLELLAIGKSPKDIAQVINLSLSSTYTIIHRVKGENLKTNKVKLNSKTRTWVVAYLLSRGYKQKSVERMIGVSNRVVKSVKKSEKMMFTQEEIERLILENSDVDDFEKFKEIKLKVQNDEKIIAEMLQRGCKLKRIAETLNMTVYEIRGIIDKLVFNGKVKLTDENMDSIIPKQGKKKYEKENEETSDEDPKKEQTQRPIVEIDAEYQEVIERMKKEYSEKCKMEIRRLSETVKKGDISFSTKERIYKCCRGIVENGENLTADELSILSEAIAYGEGKLNIKSIKLVADGYIKLGNVKPAIRVINVCINMYGESSKLTELRNFMLEVNKKQLIMNCLKQGLSVKQTMDRVGVREVEVISVKRQYIDGVANPEGKTTKYAECEK